MREKERETSGTRQPDMEEVGKKDTQNEIKIKKKN